jgi:hypothetical protein
MATIKPVLRMTPGASAALSNPTEKPKSFELASILVRFLMKKNSSSQNLRKQHGDNLI